jgi:DNA-binding NtrC family response regulator
MATFGKNMGLASVAPAHQELDPGLAKSTAVRPQHMTGKSRNGRSEPDAQISSLKILALALLRRIENLERRAANNEPADLDAANVNVRLEVRRFEAELIRSALTVTGGRQRRAALLLGMKVTTLNAKIRRYEIAFDHPRNGSGN